MAKKKTENVVRPIAHWEQANYSYVDLDNGGVRVKVAGIGCSNCMASLGKILCGQSISALIVELEWRL